MVRTGRPAHRAARAALAAIGLGLAASAGAVRAAPEPSPVPIRWEFDLHVGPLRLATVDVGDGPRTYLYLTYRVENNTGEDRNFFPSFELSTEEARVLRAGAGVPAAVTREIIRRLGNPLLQDPIDILGLLLQGEENARDGIAIWPIDNLRVDRIHIYAAGFSGEIRRVEAPDPETGQMRQYVLRKTLWLRYATPGELLGRGSDPIPPSHRPQWIMR